MDPRPELVPCPTPRLPLAGRFRQATLTIGLLLAGASSILSVAPAAVAPLAPASTPVGELRQGASVRNAGPDAIPLQAATPPATTAAVLPDPWFEPGHDRPLRITATYTVTTAADTGSGSLRAAIVAANTNPGLDLIAFSIPGGGVQTIAPTTPLPDLVQPVVIDGTTQPGYAGLPLIELSGALCPAGYGLAIRGGGSTVRGLVINRWKVSGTFGGDGIYIDTAGGNKVEACYLGTNATGTAGAPNQGVGIFVIGATSQNLIGGTTAAARNVISGNGVSGIALASGGAGRNVVRGNYIGLDRTGNFPVPNQANGVFVNSPDDTIGGNIVGARNVISANVQPHVYIGQFAPRTVVLGNYIGTDLTGTLDVGNPMTNGVTSGSPGVPGSANAVIGDTTALGGNLIAGNDFPNVYLLGAVSSGARVAGNTIGLNVNRSIALGDGNGIVVDQANDVVLHRNYVGGTDFAGIVMLNASRTALTGNVVGLGGSPGLALGNSTGIVVSNSPRTVIGGTGPADGNTVAGNSFNGIDLRGAGSSDCRVVGNRIGTDALLTPNVGNALNGIILSGSRDTIGVLGAGNTIAFNGRAGIYDSTGVDNRFRFNVLKGNGELGIDLLPRGLTKNDLLDTDGGANGLINFPFLDSALVIGNTRRVYGRMEGKPNTSYRIDLFRNEACDPGHFGEAQEWLGEALITTDGAGVDSFFVDLPLPTIPPPTPYITATATDATGNTSELSMCLCLDDSDGDGLMDCWETDGWGIDINQDGVIDLDLFARTARADHKDLLLEMDAISGSGPSQYIVDKVVDAFANVPNTYLGNPDGLAGINLWVELSDLNLPFQALSGSHDSAWSKFATIKDANFGNQVERDDPNSQHILRAKRMVYRYGLWVSSYRDSTVWGIGEITDQVTDDFIISYFKPKSDDHKAGTFMHEFGHTLGLRHGGGDSKHYKPNYYSVMNYMWTNPQEAWQVDGSWKLDYSPVAMDPLDETALDETVGMNVPEGIWKTVSVPYRDSSGVRQWTKLRPQTPVDWSGNGNARNTSVIANISNVPTGYASPLDTLYGYADWSNITYEFRRTNAFTWSGPSKLIFSSKRRAPVLLGEEEDLEPGPWLDELMSSLPPPQPKGWFDLDGQLDAGIPLVATNGGTSLYASYRDGQLYVATQGAPTADVHVLVASSPPGALQPAPRGKAGQVAAWGSLLAELGPAGQTAWTNPAGVDLSQIAVDSTNAFLEGVIDVELLDGALPPQLWVAVGRYGSGPGGTLQAQVPAGNGNGNIEANEFAAIVVPVGVPSPPPVGEPGALSLSAAQPNPTSGEAHLRFRLPVAADVEASLYDVAGRRVGLLARGRYPAGEHGLLWNGTAHGQRAPAGVYFVTLSALGERRTTRVVMLP